MSIPRATLGPLEVSALALGTWRTFERMPRERAVATLRHARELGITFLDEARYDDETGSAPIPSGYSEVLLGQLFFEAGFAREGGVVVSEKLWWQFWPEQSAAEELAQSLERLRFDSVELIYAVHPPEGLEVARVVDEIAGILAAGEAQAWGVANWTAEQIEQALGACAAAGIDPPCAAQLPYSLVRRDWAGEQRMLDALRAGGTGLVASAVLEGGLLSGRYARPGAAGRLAGAAEDPAHRARAGGGRCARRARARMGDHARRARRRVHARSPAARVRAGGRQCPVPARRARRRVRAARPAGSRRSAHAWPPSNLHGVGTEVATVVALRRRRVLLVRQPRSGLLALPGGHVEAGESARDAAARELAEETGIHVEPGVAGRPRARARGRRRRHAAPVRRAGGAAPERARGA